MSLTHWIHPDLVRLEDQAGPVDYQSRAVQLALRQPAELRGELPRYPLGVAVALLAHRRDAVWPHVDVLDVLSLVVELRRLLNMLEWRVLTRAAHWKGWTKQDDFAAVLGVSRGGVTRRRERLTRALPRGGVVKRSPQTPFISRQEAETAARVLVDRRAELQDEADRMPDPQDLVGVVSYALQHENEVGPEVFAADLLVCERIIVALRWQLDDVEDQALAAGRRSGMPNEVLGAPLGRLGASATWRARRRYANGLEPGGRRVVTREPMMTAFQATATIAAVVQKESGAIRGIAMRLLEFREELDVDANMHEWMDWLAEDGVADEQVPLTPGMTGLLWTVLGELDRELNGELDQDDGSREAGGTTVAPRFVRALGERLEELRTVVADGLALRDRVHSRGEEQDPSS